MSQNSFKSHEVTTSYDHNDYIRIQDGGVIKAIQTRDFATVRSTIVVTSAQVLALNATPKTLVNAISGGLIIIDSVHIHKPAGVAYAGVATGEDLVVRYTNGSGTAIITIETTGFLDQTTAQSRYSANEAVSTDFNTTGLQGKPVVLHIASGEIITGDSDLAVTIDYKIIRI